MASQPLQLMADVISDQQRQLNAALHSSNDQFGNRADAGGLARQLPATLARLHELGVCRSVLDYGTGKGALVQRLRAELPGTIRVEGYDPAVAAYAKRPSEPADVLTCLDVLEHIELAQLDAVLREIHQLTRHFCYLVIDLQPAKKMLADGRNAHILLAPPEWWVSRISQLFACQASFPVMHRAGVAQKLVIAACHQPEMLPMMYSFLIKLNVFNIRMTGGILEGMVKAQGQKA